MSNVLEAALVQLPKEGYDAFMDHLKGGTSADYLSNWLARYGYPVSATTLKTYRRKLGVVCK